MLLASHFKSLPLSGPVKIDYVKCHQRRFPDNGEETPRIHEGKRDNTIAEIGTRYGSANINPPPENNIQWNL
jgi:hypothetical protein